MSAQANMGSQRPSGDIASESLGGYFVSIVARTPERIFIEQPDLRLTYGEVAITVASTIERLRALGIGAGDRIASYQEEQVPGLFLALASALTGIVMVPLSPVFSSEYFVSGIVRPSAPKAVFTTVEHARALVNVGGPLLAYPYPRGATKKATDGVELLVDREMTTEQALATCRASLESIKGDTVFMVQPTAGTTGEPKLVVRTHRAFTRYAHFVGDQISVPEDADEPIRFLLATSLTHAFGLHMVTTALRLGGSLCVPRAIDTACTIEKIRELDPVVLPLLPRMQRVLIRQHDARGPVDGPIFGPSARYVCTAGGVADAQILSRFAKSGLDILEFYGSSEGSVVAVTESGRWRPGWSGRIVADVEVAIGGDGELKVRSPGVTSGYLDDPSATAAAFTADGFYATGDIGQVSEDGWLRILGRKRDVFNTPEGSNIYPARIEQGIEALAEIEHTVLVGDQKPYMVALIVPTSPPPDAAPGASGPRAILDLEAHRELYITVGRALQRINQGLERHERVIRFALLREPFTQAAYRVVGPGKIRRDRRAVDEYYGEVIRHLYDSPSGLDHSFVPGGDRRLRPQASTWYPDRDDGR